MILRHTFRPGCAPIGLGSLGITDPKEGVDLVLRHFHEIPYWPQLPKRSRSELMIHQVASGAPFLKPTDDLEYLYDPEAALEFEYDYRQENFEKAALDPEHASGWFVMMDRLNTVSQYYTHFKSQFPGPFTLASLVRDKDRNVIGYEPEILQTICRYLEMHAHWQTDQIKKHDVSPILFIDEAVISKDYFDSLPLHPAMIEELLAGVVHSAKNAGALVGIHCCTDANWSLLIDTDVDILSFDCINYLDSFLKCSDSIHDFLHDGGSIAWGVVPTQAPLPSVDDAVNTILGAVNRLVDDDLSLYQILQQSMVSATCGLGLLSPKQSEENCQLTEEVARSIRRKYLDV